MNDLALLDQDELDLDYLPPELALDPYNPINSEYFKNMEHLKRLIVMASQGMKPSHIEVAKRKAVGERPEQIAEKVGLKKASVYNIVIREDVKRLLALLQQFSILNSGPTVEHRKRVLWEIVYDNQELDPRVAISAIMEMNKMDGVHVKEPDKTIEININQQFFPRGALDA